MIMSELDRDERVERYEESMSFSRVVFIFIYIV